MLETSFQWGRAERDPFRAALVFPSFVATELERTKRELQANLGLITPDSPAHVPIQAHMRAIDAELAERADNRASDYRRAGKAGIL